MAWGRALLVWQLSDQCGHRDEERRRDVRWMIVGVNFCDWLRSASASRSVSHGSDTDRWLHGGAC